MSDYIKNQLKKCVWANLNNYDEETNTYFIPQYTKPQYKINNCYIIKLPLSFINNPNTVLATNWNNGTSPSYRYLKIYVSKTMSTLIYVDSIPVDPNTKQEITGSLSSMWSGWLDTNLLEQIAIIQGGK